MDWEASRGWGRLRGDEGSQSKTPKQTQSSRHRPSAPGGGSRLRGTTPGEGGEARRVLLKGKAAEISLPGCGILQSGQRHGKASKVHPRSRQKRSCERHGGARRARPEPPFA